MARALLRDHHRRSSGHCDVSKHEAENRLNRIADVHGYGIPGNLTRVPGSVNRDLARIQRYYLIADHGLDGIVSGSSARAGTLGTSRRGVTAAFTGGIGDEVVGENTHSELHDRNENRDE